MYVSGSYSVRGVLRNPPLMSLYLRLFLRISCQLIFVQIYSICKFHTGEPCLSAVCRRKQNQFIISTTHFRSEYVSKSFFCRKKAVHCGGALLKNQKLFSLYLLNGYRYRKNVNRFKFQVLKAVISKIFLKKLMTIKSTLLKIRKHVKFLYLWNYWRKKFMQQPFIFKKYEESLVKILGESE